MDLGRDPTYHADHPPLRFLNVEIDFQVKFYASAHFCAFCGLPQHSNEL